MNIALLRPSNVYGVPDAPTVERSTLVPMCFVKTALQGGPITLLSSGRQKRNFVSTDEVADMCLHLLETPVRGAEVVNAASNWLVSIHELAIEVALESERRSGTPLEIFVRSSRPESGNEFTIDSRYAALRSGVASSKERMRATISYLFDHFAASAPEFRS
jgi:UDP-glucose 4-epimerase